MTTPKHAAPEGVELLLTLFDRHAANIRNNANAQACVARDEFIAALAALTQGTRQAEGASATGACTRCGAWQGVHYPFCPTLPVDRSQPVGAGMTDAVLTGQNYGWIGSEYFDCIEDEYKRRFAALAAKG